MYYFLLICQLIFVSKFFKYSLVYPANYYLYQDPEGNKIKQWNSVKLESGILTLNLELSDQPVLGDWTIRAVTNKVLGLLLYRMLYLFIFSIKSNFYI